VRYPKFHGCNSERIRKRSCWSASCLRSNPPTRIGLAPALVLIFSEPRAAPLAPRAVARREPRPVRFVLIHRTDVLCSQGLLGIGGSTLSGNGYAERLFLTALIVLPMPEWSIVQRFHFLVADDPADKGPPKPDTYCSVMA
jgi:hypothetical protein